jgi:ABC-type transport system involved in multi-copper enzyme maturation permease subunit
LFGILLWLAFNLLYPVITLVLSSVLFANNFEAQFQFLQASVLGNPSQIYQQLVAFAAQEDIGSGFGQFGGTALDLPVVAAAAGVWLALLLVLALWTFHRKAA